MTEARVQNEIRLALGREVTLFRNNVGKAWTGDAMNLPDGSVLIRNPRILHAGLCKGSSDLIGWRSVTVTPDMIGQQVAVFSAIEVKGPRGRATPEQVHFINTVISAGGFGCVAKSASDARCGLGFQECD